MPRPDRSDVPRVVFAGSGTPLKKVLDAVTRLPGIEFTKVYTDVERHPEIAEKARRSGAAVYEIERMRDPRELERLRAEPYDWLFSVNSTLILSKDVLATARRGALNMHPGRLPDYAGLHTHQWAIRNDERRFAATLHWMEANVDTGPIAYVQEVEISPRDTGLSLFMKCLDAGTEVTVRALTEISRGQDPPRTPQDLSRRRLYRHRDALDGRIRWNAGARSVHNFVRAASYGPFRSPTYEPETSFRGRTLLVRKTELSEEPGGASGTIVEIASDGILVSCGDGRCVKVLSVALPEARVSLAEAVSELLH